MRRWGNVAMHASRTGSKTVGATEIESRLRTSLAISIDAAHFQNGAGVYTLEIPLDALCYTSRFLTGTKRKKRDDRRDGRPIEAYGVDERKRQKGRWAC